MKHIDDEWARVAQNPDNMIVSDSLRESIEKLMAPDDLASESMPIAVFQTESEEVQVTLLRIQQTSKGWTIVGVASLSAGIKVLQTDCALWKKAAVLHGGDSAVWSRELSSGDIRVDVDFPAITGDCTITLGFTPVSVQTRVL